MHPVEGFAFLWVSREDDRDYIGTIFLYSLLKTGKLACVAMCSGDSSGCRGVAHRGSRCADGFR